MFIRNRGLEHLKDDLRIQRKYKSLENKARKVMPLIFRSEDQKSIERMCSTLRCYLPKGFFNMIKKILHDCPIGKQALGFAPLSKEGIMEDPPLIEGYIKDLYKAPENQSTFQQNQHDLPPIEISDSELEMARAKLSSGKASGLDLFLDKWLKNQIIWQSHKEKIRSCCEDWLNGKPLPSYLKTGRIFCLSKEDSSYPQFGKIRTITILPVLTKLYELIIR